MLLDAAVAVGFALGSYLSRSWKYWRRWIYGNSFKGWKNITIDYREKAPLAAYRDMYLDKEGNISHLSKEGTTSCRGSGKCCRTTLCA